MHEWELLIHLNMKSLYISTHFCEKWILHVENKKYCEYRGNAFIFMHLNSYSLRKRIDCITILAFDLCVILVDTGS